MELKPKPIDDEDEPEIPTMDQLAMSLQHYDAVLERVRNIYIQRNAAYRDVWKEYGWRGSLVHLRTCVTRAWRQWWGAAELEHQAEDVKTDNLVDAINYAVFTIMAIEEGNRDGTWWEE